MVERCLEVVSRWYGEKMYENSNQRTVSYRCRLTTGLRFTRSPLLPLDCWRQWAIWLSVKVNGVLVFEISFLLHSPLMYHLVVHLSLFRRLWGINPNQSSLGCKYRTELNWTWVINQCFSHISPRPKMGHSLFNKSVWHLRVYYFGSQNKTHQQLRNKSRVAPEPWQFHAKFDGFDCRIEKIYVVNGKITFHNMFDGSICICQQHFDIIRNNAGDMLWLPQVVFFATAFSRNGKLTENCWCKFPRQTNRRKCSAFDKGKAPQKVVVGNFQLGNIYEIIPDCLQFSWTLGVLLSDPVWLSPPSCELVDGRTLSSFVSRRVRRRKQSWLMTDTTNSPMRYTKGEGEFS